MTSEPFDAHGAYRLCARVGLRPEPFGALAYHYDTRRLVFLKSPELVTLVQALADHDSAADALAAVVDDPARHPSYLTALASLRESGVVEPNDPDRTARDEISAQGAPA